MQGLVFIMGLILLLRTIVFLLVGVIIFAIHVHFLICWAFISTIITQFVLVIVSIIILPVFTNYS